MFSLRCFFGIHDYVRKHQTLNNSNGRIQYRMCNRCHKSQYSDDRRHEIWK